MPQWGAEGIMSLQISDKTRVHLAGILMFAVHGTVRADENARDH
jgi:hypothetical protein